MMWVFIGVIVNVWSYWTKLNIAKIWESIVTAKFNWEGNGAILYLEATHPEKTDEFLFFIILDLRLEVKLKDKFETKRNGSNAINVEKE